MVEKGIMETGSRITLKSYWLHKRSISYRLAQYGLSVDDVNSVLRAAFAGSQAGVVFDEEKRFGLVVRLDKDYRQNLDDVKNLTVALPDGHQIPFEQVADISIKSGPAQVSRENTKRRITIGFMCTEP